MEDDDIYMNVKDGPPPPLPSGAADRCCRWTAVCLGILCVLLLGLSIGLAVWLLPERDQLLANQNNLLEERDQLLTNHSNLLNERDQLMRYKLCNEGLESPRCSPGWEVFRCNCYHNNASGGSWSEARKYCQSLGGDLVIIQTPEKQRFLNEFDYAGWIGLKKESGTWRWIDDTPVSTWFWSPGQPSGYSDGCAVVHQRENWDETWHDYPCNLHHWYLCEKPAI